MSELLTVEVVQALAEEMSSVIRYRALNLDLAIQINYHVRHREVMNIILVRTRISVGPIGLEKQLAFSPFGSSRASVSAAIHDAYVEILDQIATLMGEDYTLPPATTQLRHRDIVVRENMQASIAHIEGREPPPKPVPIILKRECQYFNHNRGFRGDDIHCGLHPGESCQDCSDYDPNPLWTALNPGNDKPMAITFRGTYYSVLNMFSNKPILPDANANIDAKKIVLGLFQTWSDLVSRSLPSRDLYILGDRAIYEQVIDILGVGSLPRMCLNIPVSGGEVSVCLFYTVDLKGCATLVNK